MRRILHVVGVMDRGGAETLIMNVYRHIDRSRLQFDFLCVLPRKGDYEEEIGKMGGRVFHLHAPAVRVPFLYKIGAYSRFFRAHTEYDAVHFHASHACSVVIQLLGAKLGGVAHRIVHSHNTCAPLPWLHRLVRPLTGLFTIERLACSAAAAGWMFGNNCTAFRVVKNAIPSSEFTFNKGDRERVRKELRLEENKIIIHIGRFNRQKNHLFLLRIFREIVDAENNTHLLLVGDGELRKEITTAIESLGLKDHVTMAGTRTDIAALLSAADLLLFPSLFEGLSLVLVEAQANGINILTTDNLAPETVFSSRLHQLSTSQSPNIWAREAMKLLTPTQHPDMRAQTVMAGFDIKDTAAWLSLFYSSLSGRS